MKSQNGKWNERDQKRKMSGNLGNEKTIEGKKNKDRSKEENPETL